MAVPAGDGVTAILADRDRAATLGTDAAVVGTGVTYGMCGLAVASYWRGYSLFAVNNKSETTRKSGRFAEGETEMTIRLVQMAAGFSRSITKLSAIF